MSNQAPRNRLIKVKLEAEGPEFYAYFDKDGKAYYPDGSIVTAIITHWYNWINKEWETIK